MRILRAFLLLRYLMLEKESFIRRVLLPWGRGRMRQGLDFASAQCTWQETGTIYRLVHTTREFTRDVTVETDLCPKQQLSNQDHLGQQPLSRQLSGEGRSIKRSLAKTTQGFAFLVDQSDRILGIVVLKMGYRRPLRVRSTGCCRIRKFTIFGMPHHVWPTGSDMIG